MKNFDIKEVTISITNFLLLVGFTTATILVDILVPPTERGYFPFDQNLSYPLQNGQKFPLWAGILIVCALPCFIILPKEFFKMKPKTRKDYLMYFYHVFNIFTIYFFCLAMGMFISSIGKVTFGRLRPDFFGRCKPNYSLINDTSSFITRNICTGSEALIKVGRTSWPSGISTLTFSSFTFLVIYLHSIENLIIRTLQFLIITCGFSISFTRLSDYSHHWEDVLSGICIGIFSGTFGFLIHQKNKI